MALGLLLGNSEKSAFKYLKKIISNYYAKSR